MNYIKKIVLVLAFLISAHNIQAWTYPEFAQELPYEYGMGTEESPYVITNAQQLANLSYYVNNGTSYEGAYFKLGNDIDLNPGITFNPENETSYAQAKPWIPIGVGKYFKGNFDGDGKKISGLYLKGDNKFCYNASITVMEGLFGWIDNITLSNLTINNSLICYNITGNEDITGIHSGFFASSSYKCNFYNLKNEGNVSINYNYIKGSPKINITVAGIVASARTEDYGCISYCKKCENYGSIKLSTNCDTKDESIYNDDGLSGIMVDGWMIELQDCHNYGDIDGGGYLQCAGIALSVGNYSDPHTIEFCDISNSGNINGGSGLFLQASANKLKNSYNTGNIIDGCGIMEDCQFFYLENCYNEGEINGRSGLIGYSDYLSGMTKCHNTGNVKSTQNYGTVAGLIGGTGPDHVTLTDCYNTGNIIGKFLCAGGLVASVGDMGATFCDCQNIGDVTGGKGCGGILGRGHEKGDTNFKDCENQGKISGISEVGGIVGEAGSIITMYNSNNSGDISADKDEYDNSYAGGLIGRSGVYNECVVNRSYNTGAITANGRYVGGIGGMAVNLSECYNHGDVKGDTNVGGLLGRTFRVDGERAIINCNNTGNVTGNDFVAGLCSCLVGLSNYCFNYGNIECKSNNRALLWIYGNSLWIYDDMVVMNGNIISSVTENSISFSLPQDNYDISRIYSGPYNSPDSSPITMGGEIKSEMQFSSGEVCVLLNANQSPYPWGQTPGIDPYPLLNGKGNPDIDGISPVTIDTNDELINVYNIEGRKINITNKIYPYNLPSGIFIINGVKTVIQ